MNITEKKETYRIKYTVKEFFLKISKRIKMLIQEHINKYAIKKVDFFPTFHLKFICSRNT